MHTRRAFIGGLAAAAGVAQCAPAGAPADKPSPDGLLAGEPVLQAPAPDSMVVVFAVTALANGFAEVADNAGMVGASRFTTERRGPLSRLDDRVLQVTMTGLKPGVRYWYRVGATRQSYGVGYWRRMDKIHWSSVHSFVTPGESAPSRFGMMCDTHGDFAQMARITAKYRELGVPLVVWNGDVMRSLANTREELVELCLLPLHNGGYAADVPIAVTRGNHDFRGTMATRLHEVLVARPTSERAGRYADLEYNFAIRMGDIAVIGLDTGEDKPDGNPANAWSSFTPYRRVQAEWLEEQFKRPEIATAPYVVAAAHIPLVAPYRNANPGTSLEGRESAVWHRECAEMWGPILTANRVQLLLSGHLHRYYFTAATHKRPWAQIVGGGIGRNSYQTLVDCNVECGELVVRVHNTDAGTVVGEHRFKPRC